MDNFLDTLGKKLKFDTRYVFHGGGWLMLGYIATFSTVLATSYVFANFIDPSIYGQYKYLLTVGAIISSFALTGIGTAIVQGVAKNVSGFYRFALLKSFKYGLITSAVALIGSLYYYWADNILLSLGLLIIAALQPLMNSLNLVFSYLNGAQQFKVTTTMSTCKTIFVSTALITTTLVSQSVLVILTAYFLSHIFSNFVVHLLSKPDLQKTEDSTETVKLFKYSKHTSLQNILQGISNQLDKIVVFQNMGAIELATYIFATALPDQYKNITKSIESLLLPRFSQQTKHEVKTNIARKSFMYFLFLMFLVVIYIVIAPLVFSVLFPIYIESIFLSQIYVLGLLFSIAGIPISALKSELNNKKLYIFNLSSSVFQILTITTLFMLYGLLGVILAKVVTRGYVCLTAYILYLRN